MQKKIKLYGKSRSIPLFKNKLAVLSWVIRGKIRKTILINLKERCIPSDLVAILAGKDNRKSSSYYSQVSRGLAELERAGLIKCLNPEEKTGRFYILTKRGLQLFKELKKP